jgi:GT2 family glycosyltransferase
MLDVSIIVVNWNGRNLLARCLQCVETTIKRVSYETIVVDNASTDGSQEMVQKQFPNIKLIQNNQNVGFASANNQAMEIAQGRYVLLLNSDAFVKDCTVDTMVAFMDKHPEAGMAACKLLYEDGTVQPSCSHFPTLETEFYTAVGLEKLFPNSPTFGKYMMHDWDHNDVREVDVILGAFMLVRREAIEPRLLHVLGRGGLVLPFQAARLENLRHAGDRGHPYLGRHEPAGTRGNAGAFVPKPGVFLPQELWQTIGQPVEAHSRP